MEDCMIEQPISFDEERAAALGDESYIAWYDELRCERCDNTVADCTCPVHCDGCGKMVARGADCKCSARDEDDERCEF